MPVTICEYQAENEQSVVTLWNQCLPRDEISLTTFRRKVILDSKRLLFDRIPRLAFLFLLGVAVYGADAQPVRVEVDAGRVIRPVNPLLYGLNTARWDESLFPGPPDEMLLTCDRDAITKVQGSGITMLKYPGGNDADSYIWNSPGNNAGEMDTDEYLALCRAVGAEPFITINFNQPVALAAEWVLYCNKVRGNSVKFWEVGDEQWAWWAKGHSTPEEYAAKYSSFVKAMKAVDPTIKVATNVPLGPHPEQWTERVLRAAGHDIDMVTVTFYPQQWGKENDDTLLASVALYREHFLQLRHDVERVLGKNRADEILYVNVGYNSVNHSPGPQTLQVVNALWVADMLGTMATIGTDVACYWALHNFFPPRGGDYGYLSSDGDNTPRYNYFVFPMFARHFGRELVAATSSDPSVSVYAARAGKMLALFAINKNRHVAKELDIAVRNFNAGIRAHAWILDETRRNEPLPDVPVSAAGASLSIPPYAFVTLQLTDRDSAAPPQNLAASASTSASSFSTIGVSFTPASAIDGKLYTRWNSAAWKTSDGNERQWLRLAWDRPQRCSLVRIYWGESFASEYSIETSGDGKEWRTVKDVPQGHGGVEEFSFAPVTMRYLRMNGRHGTGGRATISAYSIREIEVYDMPGRSEDQ